MEVFRGVHLINEIDAYGGPEAMSAFTINIEDGNPTSVESGPMGIVHTCHNGQQVMRDQSGTYVMQIYDGDGNPTMMEP